MIKKLIKAKYGEKCDEEDITKMLERIIYEFDPLTIKLCRSGKAERKFRQQTPNEGVQISPYEEV
jgi:hypothetical protein